MRHSSDLLTRVKEYPVSNFSHFFSLFCFSFFLFFCFIFFSHTLHPVSGTCKLFLSPSFFSSSIWQLTSTISTYLSYRKLSIQREFMNLTHMSISDQKLNVQIVCVKISDKND